MKAAVYLRVSTTEQNAENQLPALETYAASQGWTIAGVYSEEASAWRAGYQRELSRMLEDLRSGKRKYDHLLVWSLDRLSRQGPLQVLTLLDSFRRLGCPVVSVKEPWSDAPFSDAMFSLVAWVARYESERRSERTRAGLARVAKEGRYPGRPKGSKDKPGTHRRKSGYLQRWINNRPARVEANAQD